MKKLLMPSLSAFFLTILPFLTSSVIGIWMIQHENLLKNFGWKEWGIVCVGCVVGCALALIPPTLLAFGFGYFWGWRGFIPLISLNLAAITLVYSIVHQMNKKNLLQALARFPRVAIFLDKTHDDQVRFVFFTKLSPVLPFALTNLIFALMGLRLRNILVGGFLGMIPRTALAVWIGTEAKEIGQLIENPNENMIGRMVIISLVVVSVVGLLRFFGKNNDSILLIDALLIPICYFFNQPMVACMEYDRFYMR
ncbi:MAG: VTT domain-containing protein [Spirosomataceae bacterium]